MHGKEKHDELRIVYCVRQYTLFNIFSHFNNLKFRLYISITHLFGQHECQDDVDVEEESDEREESEDYPHQHLRHGDRGQEPPAAQGPGLLGCPSPPADFNIVI